MSRLTDLITEVKAKNSQVGTDIEREFKALSSRLPFGLNFERHRPEAVELPLRPIRKGDKVRVLPERGSTVKGDQRLWQVVKIAMSGKRKVAHLQLLDAAKSETQAMCVEDLVVVAEFKDTIYPGLVSTGKVERGGGKPYHAVINAENYHALKALTWSHRGKVDAIYIDPPYNTGARDWKYNNDYVEGDDLYRHSKWLAFMERRLLLAKQLLNPVDSVLIVTIDEKEYTRLGLLLEQTFPEARIQMVSSQINPAVVARAGGFGRADEYLFIVMFGSAAPQRIPLDREWVSSRGRTHTGTVRWDLLRRSGTNAERSHSPGCFYPIYVDPSAKRIEHIGPALGETQSIAPKKIGLVPILPIRKNKSEGNWQWSPGTLKTRLAQGRVRIGGNVKRGFTVYILKDGEYAKVSSGEFNLSGYDESGALEVEQKETDVVLAIPGTQWRLSSHDATQYGTRLLAQFLPNNRKFPFPKSLYAVEDVLRFFVGHKPHAIILDYFAGSGTTAHAIMRLNHRDGGRRQCISISNNEVSSDEQKEFRENGLRPADPDWEEWGICDHITKPRIAAAITGKTPGGELIRGDYKFSDEFPISEGFEENAAFFTLTYETPVAVSYQVAFPRIAPLLWMRAGSSGRCIEKIPSTGWEVVDAYGLLTELDQAMHFLKAVRKAKELCIVYIVTDDERRFQALARRLPERVEAVRLYESYLTNFAFASGSEE